MRFCWCGFNASRNPPRRCWAAGPGSLRHSLGCNSSRWLLRRLLPIAHVANQTIELVGDLRQILVGTFLIFGALEVTFGGLPFHCLNPFPVVPQRTGLTPLDLYHNG